MRMCCRRIDIAEWKRTERCGKMMTWHGTELEACIDLAFGVYITERNVRYGSAHLLKRGKCTYTAQHNHSGLPSFILFIQCPF